MTIPEAEPHIRAVMALLGGLPFPAGLGQAPPGTDPPYVVVYPDPGDVAHARLCGGHERITVHWMLHAVGSGPEQATWAGDKTRLLLLGSRPVVVGRRCYPITQSMGPPPIRRDDDLTPPLYLQVTEYEQRSDPA